MIIVNSNFTWTKSGEAYNPNAFQDISLKFIKPKVVFGNGMSLPTTVKFGKDQTQLFKLVNEDNREIIINYDDVTVNKPVDNVGYTMFREVIAFHCLLIQMNQLSSLLTLMLYTGK